MRYLSVLVAVCAGMPIAIAFPVGAHAGQYCSTEFGGQAELSEATGRSGWLLKIPGKPDEYFDNEADELTSAEIIVWQEGIAEPQQQVWIIRDRIFWPCK